MLRWMAIGASALVATALWSAGIIAHRSEEGYFSPRFAPDGRSVYAIRRQVRATKVGLGYSGWTPPAWVLIHTDRLALVNIRVADGARVIVEQFQPSPLEGRRLRAYHGALFGVGRAHLRWADRERLEYDIAVTRHDEPESRTFVMRGAWDAAGSRLEGPGDWRAGTQSMGGIEPEQIFGDMEAIEVPGEELLPCAIVLLRRGTSHGTPLVHTRHCRTRDPEGLAATTLSEFSRRAEIERSSAMKSAYASALARERAAGVPEGEAMLRTNKEMERLGYYPRSPTLVAAAAACDTKSTIFAIADEEFRVGLFPDLEKAIASPGVAVDKSIGTYITHRDYDTSRALNEFLAGAGPRTFYVRGAGGCWRVDLSRP